MLKILEVSSEERFEELRQQEKPNTDYLYLCKHLREIKISDNGTLISLGQNLNGYTFDATSINSNTKYGIHIMFGIASRYDNTDNISPELKNLGFTMDNSINDLITILKNTTNQVYCRLDVNDNTSNFNKSLLKTNRNILEIHITGDTGYVRCFYLDDGSEYTAPILNKTIGEWGQILKASVT